MHLAVLLGPSEIDLLVHVLKLLDLRVQVINHGTLLGNHEGGLFKLKLGFVHFLDVLCVLRRDVFVELVAIHFSISQGLLGIIEDFFRFKMLTAQLCQVFLQF